MKNLDFEWLTDKFMLYCRSTQLRPQTMKSYEQTLRLFERWCLEQMEITTVDKVTKAEVKREAEAQKEAEEKKQIENMDESAKVSAIKGYKELLDEGIITQEEFAAKKKQLLGL